MSRSLRIGMYAGRLPEPGRKPGGGEVYVHRLADALVAAGHEVTVLAYSDVTVPRSYAVRTLRPAVAAVRRPLKKYVAAWQFNWADFRDFDVMHFHGDDWFYFRRRLPTVRTFHGSALYECLNAGSRHRRVDQAAVFGLELLSAKLATASYAVGSDSRAIYGADGLLNCGIEPPAGDRRPSATPLISFIGTWAGRKRGSMLHDVFQREVRPRIPDAQLVMVADHCEPGPNVTWLRHPSDAEVVELLRSSWAFCLPSSYEGFGLPYLEAMACGAPVLATPNPGAEDLIRVGACGLIAEPEAIGDELVRLMQSASLRDTLSSAGLTRAGDFAWNRMVKRHEAAYDTAITRWRAAVTG